MILSFQYLKQNLAAFIVRIRLLKLHSVQIGREYVYVYMRARVCACVCVCKISVNVAREERDLNNEK